METIDCRLRYLVAGATWAMMFMAGSSAAQDVAIEGFLGQELDAILGAIAAGNVDAGVGVGHGVRLRLFGHDESFPAIKFQRR